MQYFLSGFELGDSRGLHDDDGTDMQFEPQRHPDGSLLYPPYEPETKEVTPEERRAAACNKLIDIYGLTDDEGGVDAADDGQERPPFQF